jgi:hypothetical protein
MVFRNNPRFAFHDSRSFEAGGQAEFDKVKASIARRSTARFSLFILSCYTMCLTPHIGLYALRYDYNMHEYIDSRRTMYVLPAGEPCTGTGTTANTCLDPYHLCATLAVTFRFSHVIVLKVVLFVFISSFLCILCPFAVSDSRS